MRESEVLRPQSDCEMPDKLWLGCGVGRVPSNEVNPGTQSSP